MTRRRVYYERGRPVEVLIWWGSGGGPHNVLIRRASGELLVRPVPRAPQGSRASSEDHRRRSLTREPGPADLCCVLILFRARSAELNH